MAYNFSNEEQVNLIETGKYEVTLHAELTTTKDKTKEYINCRYTIRSDVEQESKNRVVIENIWRDKNRPDCFDLTKLQKILLVQGKEGRYTFSNDIELIQFINGLNMRVTIEKKDIDQWHDKPYNAIKYLSYEPSLAKPQEITPTAVETSNVSSIDDDDLPF